MPETVGVQVVVKGNAVTVASVAPLTENRTDVTLPSASAAAATRVWAVLTVTVPAAGEAGDGHAAPYSSTVMCAACVAGKVPRVPGARKTLPQAASSVPGRASCAA